MSLRRLCWMVLIPEKRGGERRRGNFIWQIRGYMRFPEGQYLEKNYAETIFDQFGGMITMNETLRLLREHLNLSIQDVADATGLSFRTVLRAEQGAPLNPESRRRLCIFYDKKSEELGLVPRRRQAETEPFSNNCNRIRVNIYS